MCGIAGFTTFHRSVAALDTAVPAKASIKAKEQAEACLVRMGESIAHRGPDAAGTFADDKVGLAHRRLAIIDLSPAGEQPMHIVADGKSGFTKGSSESAAYSIVFNGEIYNFLELKKTLERSGVIFKSESDTEVLLHLYQQYGPGCLEKINGMFAFAIYDHQREGIFFARDRLGKKPFYYHLSEDGDFTFASELKALLSCKGLGFTINERSVYDFFTYQYVPEPYSIFKEVNKLPAAHYCWLDRSGHSIHRYWDLNSVSAKARDFQHESESKAVERIDSTIRTAVKQRMISDVPLGAFLSGGIDSGGIVATMAELAKSGELERRHDSQIKTCSIGFEDERFNELELAGELAAHYNTEHHALILREQIVDRVEEIAAFFDEPFADPSLLPTWYVSKMAREKVTVAIAGDGGDEAFAGYAKYAADDREQRLRKRIPQFARSLLARTTGLGAKIFPLGLVRRAANLAESIAAHPAYGFFISNRFMTDREWRALAQKDLQKRLVNYHPSHHTVQHYEESLAADHLGKVLYADIKSFLVGDILVKADRCSMANSLELRAPLLDFHVMEAAALTRPDLKMKDGRLKYILKKVFSSKLPEKTIQAKKRGFDIPLAQWLREDLSALFEERVLASDARIKHYLDPNAIRGFWSRHKSGKRDHASLLWSVLMFEIWYRHYEEGFTRGRSTEANG